MDDALGKPHDSKPVRKVDKAMSKRHKDKRKQIEAMPEGRAKHEAAYKMHIGHAKEHSKMAKKVAKVLGITGHSARELMGKL